MAFAHASGCKPSPGDVVRFEIPDSGLWFYCRVDDVLDDGGLSCRIVEAQSWPDLLLAEKRPGEALRMHSRDVLSIVHRAHRDD
jgi:hypothetical protein